MAIERKNKCGYVVKITESAFIDMCLSALEAYIVCDSEEPFETYGQVWGHQGSMIDGRTIYTVEKMSIDTSAEGDNGSCSYESETRHVKTNFMESFFPNFEFLGDFHTHPYFQETRDVKKHKLYEFSPTDIKTVEKTDEFAGYDFRVGLVMTLAYVNTRDQLELSARIKDDPSVLEFHFSNYRIWLQAYVSYKTPYDNVKLTKNEVSLEVPGICGIDEPFAPFGFYDHAKREHIVV